MADHEHHLDGRLLKDGRFLSVVVWLQGDRPGLRPCELLVDTAADRTVLLRHVLTELGLPPFLAAIGAHVSLANIPPGTALHRFEGVDLGQFWLGGAMALSVDSLADHLPTELNVEGVLGMEWLAPHFARICLNLDADAPRLELRSVELSSSV